MVNSISNIQTVKVPEKAGTKEKKTPIEQNEIKDGKKKILLAIGALAIVGAARIGINVAKNMTCHARIAFEEKMKHYASLKDIKFNKGIATENGKKFTGFIHHNTKNGTVTLEYKDGLIRRASSSGIDHAPYFENLIDRIKYTGKRTTGAFEKIYDYSDGKVHVWTKRFSDSYSVGSGLANKTIHERNLQEHLQYIKKQQAQELFNKPFKDALSNKSAKNSAKVFIEALKK